MSLTLYSEDQFVQSFVKKVDSKNILGAHANYFQQLGMLNGIPDILSVDKNHYISLKNFIAKYPKLNLLNGHAKIITHLSNKVFHKEQFLLSKTGMSISHYKKAMQGLKKMNVIEENLNGSIRLVKNFTLPTVDLWSLEFKLHNWQSALRQSMRYRAFSSYVCVVMPTTKKNLLLKNRLIFNKFNIGAIVFDPHDGEYEYVIKPVKCGALSKDRYIDALGRLASLG